MPARRPQLAELGLFLLVVALPLAFTPFSTSPFGDPKLVILVGGSLALWGSGLPLDRRIGALAALWTVFTALSALTGVEPIRSLAARTDGEGGGLMLVLSCAAIVVTGVGVDADLRERTRRWFVVASCIVGALGLVFRFAPDVLTDTVGLKTLSFVGATMGNQLFAAALLAAGIAAALVPGKRLRNQLVVVAFLALGAATFGERSSLVLPAVAVVVTLVAYADAVAGHDRAWGDGRGGPAGMATPGPGAPGAGSRASAPHWPRCRARPPMPTGPSCGRSRPVAIARAPAPGMGPGYHAGAPISPVPRPPTSRRRPAGGPTPTTCSWRRP